MTKPTKNDDAQVRSAMRALSKRSLADLRASYQQTHAKDPGRMSRDALIKNLVAHAGTQPAASHPTKEEQAKAKAPRAPRPSTRKRDPRLPAVGTVLERTYKGKVHKCTVKAEGFEYDGEAFRSLTAAAKQATGYPSISGTLFWGLVERPATEKDAAPTPAPVEPPAPAKKKAGRPISKKRGG